MTVWRLTVAASLIMFMAVPLLLPWAGALSSLHLVKFDAALLFSLAMTTFWLTLGAVGVAVPAGILLSVLVFRTDLPGRRVLLAASTFALFIPTPVLVSAWQALIGADGLFPSPFWGANVNRPWSAGLPPAIWIHALAGLPWVVLIVGAGLCSVESELEEEALLAANPWRVLLHVTLPRCRGCIAVAALWVGLLTAADITVTDMLLVPTFAEEIHTQLTMGGVEGLAQAFVLASPWLGLTWIGLGLLIPRLERSMPPLQLSFIPQPVLYLGKTRWPLGGVFFCAALIFMPLVALVWKLGLAGTPRAWSASHAYRQFTGELRLFGLQVFETLGVALLTGVLVAAAAVIACWAARDHRPLRVLLLAVVTIAWTLPAPVAGIGLKETILVIVNWFPEGTLRHLLYDGPSPAPIIWADGLRFFPFAVAVMWPAVRMVPLELREAAALEGAGPSRELWHVYFSMTRRSLVLAALAVSALSLGEVGASARVETPQWESFAKLIFDRMHYGVDNNVAALSLLLLAGIGFVFVAVATLKRVARI